MNSYILIKSKFKINDIILKLKQINVDIYLIYTEKGYTFVKINYIDFPKVQKYYKYLNFKVVRFYGKKYYSFILKKYYLVFISFILIITFVSFLSFFIVDIKVENENPKIVNLVIQELSNNNIEKFTFRKSFQKLENIKKKIKSDNKDIIDFIEIERKGMIYVVKVTGIVYERKKAEKEYCNIYAKKSGIIKTITVYKGTPLIKPGSYVKKGDLIVSGDILLNENVVSTVCASAKVYAESWYSVNEKIPLKYTKEVVTNKKRNNFIINFKDKDYVILKDRLKNFTSKEELLFSGFGIKIYKRIDYEIIKKEEKYSLKDAENKALELAKEKVLLSLDEKDEILTEKVLQKSINDSILYLAIFITTTENLATLSYLGIMISNLLNSSLKHVWQALVIIIVTVLASRISYKICNKQKIVLYEEFYILLSITYLIMLYELVTRVDYNTLGGGINIIPFAEILRYKISSHLFLLNVIGNILLFVPFGFIISSYVKPNKFYLPVLISFLVSITIEFVQLNIGRSFDVDDIILNTMGATFGYLIYKIINKMPIFKKKYINYLICIGILVIILLYFLKVMGNV